MDDDNSVYEILISSFTEITYSSRKDARIFLEANEWNLDDAVSNFFNENEVAVAVASAEPNINVLNPSDQSRYRYLKPRLKLADKEVKSSEIENNRGVKVKRSYVTIWRNGYTIDDNGLKKYDDREDTKALAIIMGLDSPRKQYSPNGKTLYIRKIIRRQEEDFTESPESSLAESDNVSTETPPASSESMNTASSSLSPSMDLEIDPAAPTTRIEIRFGVGSAIVSQFNTHHTVRDIRGFIDASRPDGSRDYKLFIAGTLPPRPLTDLDQTIEEAGIADKLLIHYQISRK